MSLFIVQFYAHYRRIHFQIQILWDAVTILFKAVQAF